ncbi:MULTISPECIES: GNAT family N-acetyltransferase [Enterococcus]|uniref:Acetyltransferase n=1 Tax=Enterococcus thailandicus TaxID=417368 RepID=A0A179EPH8_ENTTH|nr:MULTISPECIES: GNAT family N-acetyltransferase [Enterococcus]ASZ08542.1 GNAT family N-acetyltransferase [Enterococcus thailandicus]MDA3965327.1 GNAT family N-acetyltransferase [Enterococcus thailandicus]MDK4352750.1 GNAT family N-acetyltransferase [Enterococcus thailandicus]MDT2734565.1 GNAT family N-acetyltransferase [Enterococcus thailandicus]MDT2752502.1 GNAT family N-acetyltransferase [Enterococcus thailandicus]
MNYQVKTFDELTTKEFYMLVKERIAVFVVEQNCPYQEVDEIDPEALHTFLTDEQGNVAAYTRIYKEEDAVHFGRVLVAKEHRQSGLGKQIVQRTLEVIEQKYPNTPIIIGAQDYLRSFYESFGFNAISDVYLEDDIPHIDMKK